jgi:hypothetical protein
MVPLEPIWNGWTAPVDFSGFLLKVLIAESLACPDLEAFLGRFDDQSRQFTRTGRKSSDFLKGRENYRHWSEEHLRRAEGNRQVGFSTVRSSLEVEKIGWYVLFDRSGPLRRTRKDERTVRRICLDLLRGLDEKCRPSVSTSIVSSDTGEAGTDSSYRSTELHRKRGRTTG